MGNCHVTDHNAKEYIHAGITYNIEEQQPPWNG